MFMKERIHIYKIFQKFKYFPNILDVSPEIMVSQYSMISWGQSKLIFLSFNSSLINLKQYTFNQMSIEYWNFLKDCVHYILASVFFIPKREHLWN